MSEKVINFEKTAVAEEVTTEMPIAIEEPIDNLFRLEEMSESMSQSIVNLEKITNEQIELCDVLENAETTNDFSEFIGATREQTHRLSAQSGTLSVRQAQLNEVIARCKDDEKIKETVLLLVDALGVFA